MFWWMTSVVFTALLICLGIGIAVGRWLWQLRLQADQSLGDELAAARRQASEFEAELVELRPLKDRADRLERQLLERSHEAERLEALKEELAQASAVATTVPSPESKLVDGGGRDAGHPEDRGGDEEPTLSGPNPAFDWRSGSTDLGIPGAKHDDDLTAIKGIGVATQKRLNALGIRAWEQLAALTEADIDEVAKAINTVPGRIETDGWVAQAADLVDRHPLTGPSGRRASAA